MTTKIKKDSYMYKLFPDFAFSQYYESLFWQNKDLVEKYQLSNRVDDDFYSIISYNIVKDNINLEIDTKSYRAIIFSDNELEIVDKYDQVVEILPKYFGRFVYAVISSDIDIYKESIKCKVIPSTNLDYDSGYIFVLRF